MEPDVSDGDDETVPQHIATLVAHCQVLVSRAEEQFGRMEDGREQYLLSAKFAELGRIIGENVAHIYFETAFIANRTGMSLERIIQANIKKLSNRVDTDTVDKDDGVREE